MSRIRKDPFPSTPSDGLWRAGDEQFTYDYPGLARGRSDGNQKTYKPPRPLFQMLSVGYVSSRQILYIYHISGNYL